MNMMTQANLYSPEPLEDAPEEISRTVEDLAAGTAYQSEMPKLAGRFYADFVQEINEAKEAKEIELTQLVVGIYNSLFCFTIADSSSPSVTTMLDLSDSNTSATIDYTLLQKRPSISERLLENDLSNP